MNLETRYTCLKSIFCIEFYCAVKKCKDCCRIEIWSKKRPGGGSQKQQKTKKIVILAISFKPPIQTSDNISPVTSSISIILYMSININLGYTLMCSMAGFSISSIAYFGWEVSRNIGSRRSTSTVFSLLNRSRICAPIRRRILLQGR